MSERNEPTFVSLNGKLTETKAARVPADISGLYYGAGCFETFRAEQGTIFRFGLHSERLHDSLLYLGIPQDKLPDRSRLEALVDGLLKANQLLSETAKVRIQFSLAETAGYSQTGTPEVICLITAEKAHVKYKPVSLITARTRVVPASCRPAHLKLSNMLHYRNAWREAQSAGADDALMLTVSGKVAETSIANIFWKKGDWVYTPSGQCDILPGIMRNSVIEILRSLQGISLQTGFFDPGELAAAESAWITNSVCEIRPVYKVDDTILAPDDLLITKLQEELEQMKSGLFKL